MSKILVSGGNGRFAIEIKKIREKNKFIFLDKKKLNILNINSIDRAIKKFKDGKILRPIIKFQLCHILTQSTSNSKKRLIDK